jgi:hypothetical protein
LLDTRVPPIVGVLRSLVRVRHLETEEEKAKKWKKKEKGRERGSLF